MGIATNLRSYAGLRVLDADYVDEDAYLGELAIRVRYEAIAETPSADLFAALFARDDVESLKALVIGYWEELETQRPPASALAALEAARERLSGLEALFIGDVSEDEHEMAWITPGDVSRFWRLLPALRRFGVRAGDDADGRDAAGLLLGRIELPRLEALTIETTALSTDTLRAALDAQAPLRELEIWTGRSDRAGASALEDWAPLLEGDLFPELTHLGVRNCAYVDEFAFLLAESPLLGRLEALDLSLGTLSDEGATALIETGALGRLKRLDITHHAITRDVLDDLRRETRGLVGADKRADWKDDAPMVAIAD